MVRHGFIVFAAMLSANVLTYAFYAGSARTLGVVASGALNSLLSAMLLVSLPTNAGSTVVAALTSAARARGDAAGFRRIGRRVNVFGGAAAIAAAAAVIAAAPLVTGYFHLADSRTVLWAALGLAFTFVLPLQRGVLQGAGSFGRFAASNLVEAVPKVLFGIGLGRSTLGLDGALAGYATAVASSFCYNAWAMSRTQAPIIGLGTDAKPRPPLLVILPVSALTAMTFYDVILVKHAFNGRDAGLYAASALVGRALLTVIAFVPAVILPKAAERIAQDRGAALRLLAMAVCAGAAIVASALAVCAAAPERIVELVAGTAYADAAPFVLPYALAMGALAGATVLASFLIGAGLLGFSVPLAVIAATEITAVALAHRSIAEVLAIVQTGHLAAFVVTAIAVWDWTRKKNTGPR